MYVVANLGPTGGPIPTAPGIRQCQRYPITQQYRPPFFEKKPPAFRNDSRLRLELPIRSDSLLQHFDARPTVFEGVSRPVWQPH